MVSKLAIKPFKIQDPDTGNEITIDDLTIQEILDIKLKQELIRAIRRIKNG